MPKLYAHQFATPSKSDYYALQKMFDAAMAYTAAPNQQDRRSVYCDARGETWFLRDRDNYNSQHQPLQFKIDGDDWLTATFDFTGSRVIGTDNPNQNLIEIENTGSGNMRDVRLTGGNWIGGRYGLKISGLDYCQVDNTEWTWQWFAAWNIKGRGARSVKLVNNGIQEPRCFSALLERGVEIRDLRACESVGGFICWNGHTDFIDCHVSGVNMQDGVKRWKNVNWGADNMWEAVGHQKPQDLMPGVPMRPVFTLTGASSVHYTGFIQNSYLLGEEEQTDNPSQANVIFNLRGAGDLNVDAEIFCDEDVRALVAEDQLYGKKDTYWTDVRLRGLTARGDMYLHKRTINFAPDDPRLGYPSVRTRNKYSGYARMHNGGQILQDNHAPVDLSNVDLVAV